MATLVATAITALAVGVGLAFGQVSPNTYSATVNPGGSVTVQKSVVTPAIPATLDVVFLADTTGSMVDAIANVQSNAGTIMSTIVGSGTAAHFGVASYKDVGDAYTFRVEQDITADTDEVQSGINLWSASGGGDIPEAQLNALFQLANGAVTFRPSSTRVIVWFGDASGHDPSNGITEAAAREALQAANVIVIAIPVDSGAADGLDVTGQATRIANATGGSIQPADPDNVSDAILTGLTNLRVTVTPQASCESGLSATFDPTTQTGTSGDTFTFAEKLSVASDAVGGTLHCTVKFLLNGQPGGDDFVQHVTIDVPLLSADLSIEKSASPTLVIEGNDVTYTYAVTNSGSGPDPNVVVTDALPDGLTFVSGSTGCSAIGPNVTCNFETVAGGATVSKSIVANVPIGAPSPLTNSASVVGDRPDPDSSNNTDKATITVTRITVNHNPVCTGLTGGPNLWPPNHKLRLVTIRGAIDPDGDPLTYTVNHVTQDERLNGAADGNTPLDAKPAANSGQVWLRAERQGTGNGRVYRIRTSVTDGVGGSCSGVAKVGVPHDRGAHGVPIDSGLTFVDF